MPNLQKSANLNYVNVIQKMHNAAEQQWTYQVNYVPALSIT